MCEGIRDECAALAAAASAAAIASSALLRALNSSATPMIFDSIANSEM
jgi:hypothetical protein